MYLCAMSDTIERRLELGKRYNFPQLSTVDVEILETVENWIEFYEKEFVWCSNYKAIWKDDEDPVTKVVADREKESYWRYTFDKGVVTSAEVSYCHAIQHWLTNIYLATSDKVIRLAFNSKEKAERMYKYFCQYKGFEHY
jgi:hypothetical protein